MAQVRFDDPHDPRNAISDDPFGPWRAMAVCLAYLTFACFTLGHFPTWISIVLFAPIVLVILLLFALFLLSIP